MEGNAPVDQRFRIEATATVAIALLTSIPALRDLFGLNPRSISQLKDGTYKDRDGESTREDVDRFSNLVPKTALLVFSIFGLASSLYISVVDIVTDSSTILRTDNWFYTSVWVCTLRVRSEKPGSLTASGLSRSYICSIPFMFLRVGTPSARTSLEHGSPSLLAFSCWHPWTSNMLELFTL